MHSTIDCSGSPSPHLENGNGPCSRSARFPKASFTRTNFPSNLHRKLHRKLSALLALALITGLMSSVKTFAGEEDYQAMLVAPKEISSGGKSSATITVFNSDGTRAADVPAYIQLLKDDEQLSLLGNGNTDQNGQLFISYDVPNLNDGDYKLRAIVAGMEETLTASTAISSVPAILIETDKPIYKPSQTIQGRVVLLDNALRPKSGEVELTIFDAKNIRIDRKQLTANEYGVASFDLKLASEVNFGVWKIRVEAEGKQTSRDVKVENYVLPRFDIVPQFGKSWVLPDERIQGTIEARYFFGKDVQGEVSIEAKRYVGEWETYTTASGTLIDGQMSFDLDPVEFIAGTQGNGGLGSVQLDIRVTDSTGHKQSSSEVITVSPSSVVVQIISQQKTIKPGLPASFLVVTESPSGDPKSVEVDLLINYFDEFGEVLQTVNDKVETVDADVTFELTPIESASKIEILASATEDGRESSAQVSVSSTYSPSASYLSLTRTGSDQAVQVGQEIEFTARTTATGTIFYEVYAGGRTVFSSTSKDDKVRFTASAEMAPSARVIAYTINDTSEVSADSASFEVTLPNDVSITTNFSNSEPRPGDEITLAIDTGHPSMVGISLVDCSVLALGRGRLHLGEVFTELEKRFMEVQTEDNNDNGDFGGGFIGGPAPGLIDAPWGGDDWWGGRSWNTPGALEVFEDNGLTVVATRGLTIPQGRSHGDWRWLEDVDFAFEGPVPVAAPGDVASPSGSGPPPVRGRQFFPETWLWEPELETDENGLALLNLTVPDSITCWELDAMSTSTEGIGFGDNKATVFQEFFIEPSLPISVTRGEEFPVAIQIFNYLEEAQSVNLELGDGSWYELLGDRDALVEVPPNSASSVHFKIRPTEIGSHEVKVTAHGSLLSDAVIRFLTVEPEGVPVTEVENLVIEPGNTTTLNTIIPEHAISESGEAYLYLTPSPIAQTLQGLAELISMPSGCGEQNMIRLAPDVEVLRYLDITGEVMPEIRAMAENFINIGYQRQLTYQTDDGGFAAFGGEEGALWLTAFVLSTFSVARDVRDIDEDVLRRAAAMLVSRQNEDGSFQTDDFLIHQEMDGGLANEYAMTAYVTNALTDYLRPEVNNDSARTALDKAGQYLVANQSSVRDSYSLSIAASALSKIPSMDDVANDLIDRLIEQAVIEGVGLHWEPYPIETTGYVCLALLAKDRVQASSAVEWLSTQRNSIGGYGHSTQDTVVAIRALTEAALKIRADLDLDVTVSHGAEGQVVANFKVDETNYDLLQGTEIPISTIDGELPTLRTTGVGNLGYQVVRKYNIPADFLPPPHDMILQVSYNTQGIEVDDLVDINVSVTYTGDKERTAMSLVEVGIPTGFAVVRSTLDALVEEKVASRVEESARRAIIYLDGLTQNEKTSFSFQMKALYPVRAEGMVSEAYAYYDPEIQASVRGPDVIVSEPVTEPDTFVRGDFNDDSKVEMTDAILNLSYQFISEEPPRCMDAADANDDGLVNITDPVHVLYYIFLGGEAPPEPFPARGVDPTADDLHCSQ